MSKKYIVLLLALVFTSSAAFGAALDNTHMGLRANSMGKAFTGLADDASAVFYNPAGLATGKDGLEIQGYAFGIASDLNYSMNFMGTDYGNNNSDEMFLIPGFFLKYKKGDIGLGLGLYVPYGGSSYKYEDISALNPLVGFTAPFPANSSIEQSLTLIAFGGSVGVKLSKTLSIGISVFGYYGEYTQTTITNGVTLQEDNVSGVAAVSGNVGILFQASEKLSLGFNVKLPVRITVDGSREQMNGMVSGDLSGELRFPFYFTLGAAYKPSEKMTVTLDVNYATYSTMSKIDLTYQGSSTNIQTIVTKYKDAFYFAAGVEFKPNSKFSVRGGITFTPNATLDSGLQLSCDVSHITYSLGASYEIIKGLTFTVGFQYLQGFERETSGSSALTATAGSAGLTPGTQTFDKDAMMVISGLSLKI